MADISKCSGKNCPLAKTCWRYIAPSNEFWQAYLSEVPYDPHKKSCGKFVVKIGKVDCWNGDCPEEKEKA